MKTIIKALALGAFAIGSAFDASAEPRDRIQSVPAKKVFVEWTGVVSDDASSHTTEHGHDLKFVSDDNGDSYDIVDSPNLVKLHHDTEKDFRVALRAEKTPKFLFWGGNLIVKSFQILEERDVRPHLNPPKKVVSNHSSHEHGGGRFK